jgi:hypothetical protein
VIIDVENGADEYGRRLASILDAHGADEGLRQDCRERLQYHAWPTLSLHWTSTEWTAAVAGADLVIFDSSRNLLSAAGLNEDKSDDYAQFANALLMPLSKNQITTLTLDNRRSRGHPRARHVVEGRSQRDRLRAQDQGRAARREHRHGAPEPDPNALPRGSTRADREARKRRLRASTA